MATKRTKTKRIKPVDVHDCAKGRMHDPFALKFVKTMPGGFIA